MVENLIYAAAVLGSLCDGSAASPGVVSSVLRKLHEIDLGLIALSPAGVPHYKALSAAEQALFDQATKQHERLVEIGIEVSIYFNDAIPTGERSRLRIEVPGTGWDSGAPLYLS